MSVDISGTADSDDAEDIAVLYGKTDLIECMECSFRRFETLGQIL